MVCILQRVFYEIIFSILALFLSFSSVLTYSILPYIAHSHSQQDVPSDIQSSALQLSDNCGIVQKRDMASVQRVCEVCYATQKKICVELMVRQLIPIKTVYL